MFFVIISLLIPTASAVVEMNEENESYIFNSSFNTVDAPTAYYLKTILRASDFGAQQLKSLDDISVAGDGSLFLADGETNTVYKLSADLSEVSSLTTFHDGQQERTLNNPVGVYADALDNLYIADRGSGFVYVFDLDLGYKRKLSPPDRSQYLTEHDYEPLKVSADAAGTVYVISANQTQGILQFSDQGEFYGFLGATKVQPTARDIFLRFIATQEQKKGLLRLIPTEYNNITVDKDNYIYASIAALSDSELYNAIRTGSSTVTPVRRLNQKGQDVLLRNGQYQPVGDVNFLLRSRAGVQNTEQLAGASKIVDVASGPNGAYSLLDSARGRIYSYDREGSLMFMLGGPGTKNDRLITPTSIDYKGLDIVVADKETATVKIFTPTAYARKIFMAAEAHEKGLYEEEKAIWAEVIGEYVGSELAYLGMGKMDMINKDYSSAMTNFRLANANTDYSEAFKEYRRQVGYKYIGWIVGGLMLLVISWVAVARLRRARAAAGDREIVTTWQRAAYAKYIAFHPFKGFWDLKMLRIGNLRSASLILAAVVAANLLRSLFSGYLFRSAGRSPLVLLRDSGGIVLILGLFVLANWCLTSLFDGKGTAKDIYIYSCYSLTPLLISTPILIVFSHFLSYSESVLFSLVSMLSILIIGFLIFTATMTVHDYSLGKTVAMLFFTAVGMIILIFIGILIVTLMNQIVLYIRNIITELQLR